MHSHPTFLGDEIMKYKTIKDWLKEWSHSKEPLLIIKLREQGFDDTEILKFLDVYEDVCHECRDGGSHCQCWNDD